MIRVVKGRRNCEAVVRFVWAKFRPPRPNYPFTSQKVADIVSAVGFPLGDQATVPSVDLRCAFEGQQATAEIREALTPTKIIH